MRLLDVQAVLDREKGIQTIDPEAETEVLRELDDKSTSYVILSHRWGNEVTYDEMTRLSEMTPRKRHDIKKRDGYQKIINCCERAKEDGYRWLWIDTCCMDKRSSSELSEAINSMYRWYHNSKMCYVYLHDVMESGLPTKQDFHRFGKSNGWPEWFSRGWTLQELIAPEKAIFFNRDWKLIGTKEELKSTLEDITRIPERVLTDEKILRSTHSWERPRIAQIISWASDRKTTRMEDRAYSLIGLFGVNMPMLYGEGSKAFLRLQLEIIRVSSDHSIFAWNRKGRLDESGSVLADDPSSFRGCHDIQNVAPDEFVQVVEAYIRESDLVVATDRGKLGSFSKSVDSTQLLRWDVTNLGIHTWLPVLRNRRDDSFYKAILPCRDRHRKLVTIDLVSNGPRSCHKHLLRNLIPFYTFPEFRSLYLDCSQQPNESGYEVRFQDADTFSCGFTRCGSFPREVASDSVTFSSQGGTLIILVYANDNDRCRFAVGLGRYLGLEWGRVFCDEYSAQPGARSSWADFARQAYDIMWNAAIPQSPSDKEDVHLPKSVFHAEISLNILMRIAVKRCPGCCDGRGGYAEIPSVNKLYPPLLRGLYPLNFDNHIVGFVECSGQAIELGDYGDFFDGIFVCRGNIFRHIEQLRAACTHPVYNRIISPVSGYLRVLSRFLKRHIVTTSSSGTKMVLRQSRGRSLPDNEDFVLLLRALSARLAGYVLVSTVVECSTFYKVDCNGKRMGPDGAQERGNEPVHSGILTPLCSITVPRPWKLHCARRQQFKRIRENFFIMADLHHIAGTEARHESVDHRTAGSMVDIAVMFGLDYLQQFMGEITFFDRLPSILQTCRRSEPFVGTVDGNGLFTHLSGPSSIGSIPQTLLYLLQTWKGPRCETGTAHRVLSSQDAPGHLLIRKPTGRHEMEFISESLSTGLLEHTCVTLHNAWKDDRPWRRGQVGEMDFDMARVYSTIKEIEALQAQLKATDDNDEQLALEEDITGQVLWFYWCGIRSEVDHILAKVADYIRENRYMFNKDHFRDLQKTADIINRTPRVGPADDIAHLQRIMFDAGAGISRHKIWLSLQNGDVMEAHAGLSLAAGLMIGSPTTSSENDTTRIVGAGNAMDTTSLNVV